MSRSEAAKNYFAECGTPNFSGLCLAQQSEHS